MKICILHIGHYLLDESSGVFQKTMAIADALKKQNIPLQIVNFSTLSSTKNHPDINAITVTKDNQWKTIDDWISKYIAPDEIIWMRYVFADHHFFELTKKWGHQMVLEHNTLEEEEALLIQKKYWKSLPFAPNRSYLKFTLETLLYQRTDEKRWGAKVLKNVLGGITVTYEISQYEKQRYPDYPTFVLPNCTQFGEDNNALASSTSSEDLSVNQRWVMLIGSWAEWHGLDRLINSLQNTTLSNNKKIQIDIIGMSSDTVTLPRLPSNIHIQFLGKIEPSTLDAQLQNYHLAIGSLAFYKIRIKEACPLKVRDYWKAGLPVLLAYRDTSCIENNAFSAFQYSTSNDQQPVVIEDIFDFVIQLYQQKGVKGEIKKMAKEIISYHSKIKNLISFLESIRNKTA